METIKNLLRPGHADDDKQLYDAQTTGNQSTHTTDSKLAGEGSHLAGSHNTSNTATTTSGSGLAGQGSHFGGSSDRSTGDSQTVGQYPTNTSAATDASVAGNDSLGATSKIGPGSGGAAGREYDPSGHASSRGITTIGGDSNDTYATKDSTTVGPDSTAPSARYDSNSGVTKQTDAGLSGLGSTQGASSHHTSSTTESREPNQSQSTGIVGSALAAVGLGGYASSKQDSTTGSNDQTYSRSGDSGLVGGVSSSQQQTSGSTTGSGVGFHEPTYSKSSDSGLAGVTTSQSTSTPHASSRSNDAFNQSSDNSLVGGISNTQATSRSETTSGVTSSSDNSRSTALGGAGAAAATAYGASQLGHSHDHTRSDTLGHSNVTSDNSRSVDPANNSSGYSSTTGGSYHTGPIGSSVGGPHTTFTANLLDPKLNNSSAPKEDAIRHYETQGGGAEKADEDHHTTPKTVAAGAVGLGALGLNSGSNESRFTNQGQSDVQREGHSLASTNPTSTQIPDRTRGLNESSTTSGDGHHYGRDAALAGGAAGLAGAAYGTSHHSDNNQTTSQPISHSSQPLTSGNQYSGTSGTTSHPSHHSHHNAENTSSSQPQSSSLLDKINPFKSDKSETEKIGDDHSGRNAALGAGAVGAAGYGAHKYEDSRDRSNLGSSTTSGQNSGTPIYDSLHSSTQPQTGTTTTSSAPYSSTTSSVPHTSTTHAVDTDRTKDHHLGRDTALVGGAVAGGSALGSSGLSVEEEEKYRLLGQQERQNIQTEHQKYVGSDETRSDRLDDNVAGTSSRHTGSGAVLGSSDANVRHSSDIRSTETPSHHGRDAALLSGGAAAGAYGAHELSKEDHDKASRLGQQERASISRESNKFHESEKDKRDTHDKKHKGLFSFLRRDKNKKKFTKDEEDDYSRQHHDYDTNYGAGSAASYAAAQGHSRDSIDSSRDHTTHSTTTSDSSHKKTIGELLHGERATGVQGDNPYPHGGGPETAINQVTGQPFESSTVHGTHTIGTDGHSNLTSGSGIGATDSTTLGSDHHERNRLHKDPPTGHPASQY